jgi:preprotein translocase subunit SecF
VGPKVGAELRQKGAWSVIAATVMMGIYIWLRFELRFGLGAVVALVHDVLVTIGALIIANYEFDLTIVAALLTVVGFLSTTRLSSAIESRKTCAKLNGKPGDHYQ